MSHERLTFKALCLQGVWGFINEYTLDVEGDIKDSLRKLLSELVYFLIIKKDKHIMWTTPVATEMRFGFEVTMYVMNK